ncbi:unnamed protein product [Miscanthus lutarioriparius]|uniref:Uncharacterized protein n=1 Tax=Miscanthus lutarioriparius TaxID=422564 RepID=A0A811PGC6_9POAL|nr:unnamed protein product [Miscanthus lutarioriparius]
MAAQVEQQTGREQHGEHSNTTVAYDAFPADLFDWLGATFGFQLDNVRNQREHLVLHLANVQLHTGGALPADVLHHSVAWDIRRKLLKTWWLVLLPPQEAARPCAAKQRTSCRAGGRTTRRDTALYLLI